MIQMLWFENAHRKFSLLPSTAWRCSFWYVSNDIEEFIVPVYSRSSWEPKLAWKESLKSLGTECSLPADNSATSVSVFIVMKFKHSLPTWKELKGQKRNEPSQSASLNVSLRTKVDSSFCDSEWSLGQNAWDKNWSGKGLNVTHSFNPRCCGCVDFEP